MTLLSTTLDATSVAGILQNDLEKGVEESHPVVGELKAALLASGAAGSLMSGSGPAVFGVVRDKAAAIAVASGVRRPGVSVFAVCPVKRGWAQVNC
jgi:4-diphosphocytidyl-2-C-methyl-D-erythritol kinase